MRQGLGGALRILTALRAAPADPWLRIRSAHFERFATASERSGRGLIQEFQRVRSFFEQAFGLIPSDGKPVEIVAFRSALLYPRTLGMPVVSKF